MSITLKLGEHHTRADAARDTDQENKSVVQTLIDASADPDKVFMFNYASEALNNSFFLDSLVCLILLLPASQLRYLNNLGHAETAASGCYITRTCDTH